MSVGKIIIGGCFVVGVLFQNGLAYGYQWKDFEITPWAGVEEEYDSNITYSHSDRKSDFITTPRVGFIAIHTGKNDSGELHGYVQEEIYPRYSNFDNLSEYLSGSYQKDYSYYNHFKLDDSFDHAEEPRSFSEQFGRVGGRYDYYDNAFNTSWTHDFTSQLSIQYKFTTTYYDPQRSDLQRSVLFKPGVETDYVMSSWLSLLAYDDFSYRDYSQFGSMTKDSIGVGARNYWTPQLYLEGRAGEDFIFPIIGHNTARPKYYVSLNDQRDQRTLYTLSFTKEYQDTPYSEFLFNSWQANLELKKDLTARMSFYANVFTGGGRYVGQDIKERLNGAGAGVIIHVNKVTDVRVEYTFSDNHSNVTADTYKKSTAIIEITIKF